MRKILLILLAFLIILAASCLVYLNEVVLPEKIKAALTDNLGRATGNRVELSSAKLDIFRGLVLKDFRMLDDNSVILSSKTISARLLILPLLKKQIIITSLKFDSPEIFVERFPDNSVNISKIVFEKLLPMKWDYSLAVSRVILSGGTVNFKDNMIAPVFTRTIEKLALDIRISLPDKLVFNAQCNIPSKAPAILECSGDYRFRDKTLSLGLAAHDLYIKEFEPYFKAARVELPEGTIDILGKFSFKDNILEGQFDMTSLSLVFSRGKINADLNCGMKAKLKYNFGSRELIYAGDLDMKNLALSGLDCLGKIGDIRGRVAFSEKKLSSDNITCTVLGVPVNEKMSLPDLSAPVLNLDINAGVALGTLESILKTKFGVNIPAGLDGEGALNLALQYKLPAISGPVINGSLAVSGAALKLEFSKDALKDVKGKFYFTNNQLKWSDLAFTHAGTYYKSSGILTNFEKPGLEIELASARLALSSLLAVNGKTITLSKFEGLYDDAEFSAHGDIDTSDPSGISADIKGSIRFDLKCCEKYFEKFKDFFKNSKASGPVSADFALKGKLNDPARAAIDANISGALILIYGFRLENFSMACMQRNGVVDVVSMRSSFYGGEFDANGRIDHVSKETPYNLNADIKNVKIEKLKKDTSFKDSDISGVLQAHFGAKGFLDDASIFNGWGKISITNGKLWELNLLRGLGGAIFKKDFSSVMFKEGSCSFVIKDKAAFTDDLALKSGLLNLFGSMKIGFDKSVNASLKAEFTDEGIDAGNMSDIAGAIERYSAIEVSGTLKEPKYKLRPDLGNVMSDIADNFFKKQAT